MKKNKEMFLNSLLKIINTIGEDYPIWAAILCTVAAAIRVNKEKELAEICNSFINELKEDIFEKSEKSFDNYTYLDALSDLSDLNNLDDFEESEIIEENYEDDLEVLIDGFIFNKEGNS